MERHFCEVVPVYVRPQSMVDEQACFGVIVRCPSANPPRGEASEAGRHASRAILISPCHYPV